MAEIKTTLICTVLNESKNIEELIKSIGYQTKKPDEVIIVDGGSSDDTFEKIRKLTKKIKLNFKIYKKIGNRSVGRNEAIKKSSNQIILSTDAGCVLHKDWVKNIIKPFADRNVDVVAGFYKGKYKNIFQKSLIPYVLVMRDKVDEKSFLPATRSMAFKKTVWKKLGGFNEKLSHNEDYDFAFRIKKNGLSTFYAGNAIAYWIPRKNFFEAFKMFFRFSLGDIEAHLLRDKVVFLFLRYLFALYLIAISLVIKSSTLYLIVFAMLVGYLIWSIEKNYKYIKDFGAFFYLPALQFTADSAVILGTATGFIQRVSGANFFTIIKKNKIISFIIVSYIITIVSVINWGIPNNNHPFDYFMDEWHQSQSVRYLFSFGTPNLPGAANGSIFHFFLTGIYLIPFYLFKIVDPFSIKSSVAELAIQHKLFEVLRLNTLFFGTISIITFYQIVKKYLKTNYVLATVFFVFNPLWITLSNYFKYDIALAFWMLLSILYMFKYVKEPNLKNFVLIGVFSGIALAVKIEPISLLVSYVLVFFLFTPNIKKCLNFIFWGLLIYLVTFIFLGIPDVLFGRGNLYEYIYSNLSRTPRLVSNYFNVGGNIWLYYLVNLYPATFGKVFFGSFIASLFTGFYFLVKDIFKYKNNVSDLIQKNKFITIILINLTLYSITLIPLGLGIIANRLIPFLIFIPIIIAITWTKLFTKLRNKKIRFLFILITIILVFVQIAETYSWILLKYYKNPREVSSDWIMLNIKKATAIGIEQIPIYQSLPDNVLKDYYLKQYGKISDTYYKYTIVNKNTKSFPKFVILSNDYISTNFTNDEEKNKLIENLNEQEFRIVKTFTMTNPYFNFFNNRLTYYISSLVQLPDTISIYERK